MAIFANPSDVVIDKVTGYTNVDDVTDSYRVVESFLPNIAHPAGGGAGAGVLMTAEGFNFKDTNYIVHITPDQPATINVFAKTTTGFNYLITPVLTTYTLLAGTVDMTIKYQK